MSETILTPIMTSNTEPSGKCNASSQLATNCEAFQVFRQTNSTDPSGYYNWIAAGNVGNWISYEFDTPKKVTKLIVWNMNTSVPRAVKTFIFQGSNDGQNFTDIKTCSIGSSEGGYKSTYTISSEAYRIYRLYITEVYDSDYTAFGRIDLIGDPPRIKSSGSTEAIRDWLNASLYNKEEIDDLFIRNNQAGLIPYDLMITGDQPEQMIKLVGQTSGKTYNICLAAILGEMEYCYHGLLWFGQGEDVKIFDSDSGEELLEHTLSERKDEIELSPEYDTSSPYYMENAGTVVTDLSGRVFTKVNDGPSYGYGDWDGAECHPVLLSKDPNAVILSWHWVTHSFTYDGETWYAGGNGYGFNADRATVNRLDISSYAPFSTDSTDTYHLPIIQKATAALNIITGKHEPIPQSY